MKSAIYRAKKLNDNKYVEGCLAIDINGKYFILDVRNIYYETFRTSDGTYHGITCDISYEIDSSTLAIHFPDMIDSQGNKIFASLSEDGKGGDMFVRLDDDTKEIIDDDKGTFIFYSDIGVIPCYDSKFENYKVIGTQQ